MIKGIYTSALGLIPLEKRLEVIANNLANVDTTAFKRDDAFSNQLISATELFKNGSPDPTEQDLNQQTYTDFSQGPMEQTGNPLDVGINGQGFFVVQTSGGTMLTRDGSFTLSQDGTLETCDGAPVMGTNGPIRIDDVQQLQKSQLVIQPDGTVKAGDKIYGQLQVVIPGSYSQLSKAGGNLYQLKQGGIIQQVTNSSLDIKQGYLEGSNVNAIDEMVAMIQLQTEFQAGQKSIQSQDQSLSEANQVGQVQ